MSDYKLVPVERCAACGNEKPVSEMKTCMHNQMHRYVCDSECMNDFYNPPKNPRSDAAAPAVQGEPVGEVRFELGAPSSIFAELYSKSLPVLAPGTKLYTAPQPAEQQPRSDALIVEQTEQIAALLAHEFLGRVMVGRATFRNSDHAPVQKCWEVACRIQEELTATDVENALAELEDDQQLTISDEIQARTTFGGPQKFTVAEPQQPEPISRNLRAVHAMILSALDRDAADGKVVRGEMAAELRSALSEQQPAPDVPGLMGVLGQYFDAMDSIGREGTATSTLIAEAECDEAEARLRLFLAAHLKQEGS